MRRWPAPSNRQKRSAAVALRRTHRSGLPVVVPGKSEGAPSRYPRRCRSMHGADRFGNSNTMLVLSVTALYELAAPSTPPEAQTEVERRVAAGELVSGTNAFVAEGFSSVPL